MTHPIIKTDNYILITSDEEIKSLDAEWSGWWHGGKKVIAHLPLNNSLIHKGVPLLPPLPMTFPTIECIGDNVWEELTGGQEVSVNRADWSFGFGLGYNKAKEKYKFTEEDVIKIVEKSRETGLTAEYLMLSLSQSKLPVGFKCEIEVECTGNDNNGCFMDAPGHNCGCVKTKIINGVMQGEWIFE